MSSLKAPFPYFGGKSAIADIVWEAIGNPKTYVEPFFGSGAVLLNRDWPHSNLEIVNDKDGFLANVWRSLKFSPDAVAEWCDWPTNHADLMARKKKLIANEERLLENLIEDDAWHDPKMAGYWIWAASNWIGSGLTRPGAIPHLTGERGAPFNDKIIPWFRALQERLRFVKVVCGDWNRVCGGNWQAAGGDAGIFFDPPYSDAAQRDAKIYQHDDLSVAHDVREWCLSRGQNSNYRIVLAGYFDEHKSLLKHGWRFHNWSAAGGYSNSGKTKNQNRHKESIFFSPACLDKQQNLFQENMR